MMLLIVITNSSRNLLQDLESCVLWPRASQAVLDLLVTFDNHNILGI